ncbi:hypothetical protein F5888DRAFT_1721298 [Russula emetica]|nr:hypothetical protein F5888DRAFT_1721298 [Russula emetica]
MKEEITRSIMLYCPSGYHFFSFGATTSALTLAFVLFPTTYVFAVMSDIFPPLIRDLCYPLSLTCLPLAPFHPLVALRLFLLSLSCLSCP